MKLLIEFAAMVSLTVIANVLLKSGASAPGVSSEHLWSLLNWRVIAGLASFALGAGFYVLILNKLPLNVAQSFAAVQFVAVILASFLVLGEPIGGLRWAGIALIVAGITLVGITVK
ncbi:MAG: EamA family transporter [Rugosibacter sp.]|nr:EamA family transporter [Rugosibacter sp.]